MMIETEVQRNPGPFASEARRIDELGLFAATLESGSCQRHLDEVSDDSAILAVECRLKAAREMPTSLGRPAGQRGAASPARACPEGPRSRRAVLTFGMVVGGRYRILEVLGKGGMGTVYRAEDLRLGEAVALKVLSGSEFDSSGRNILLEELRLARRISHRNIYRVYDVGEDDGFQFLSMEYVDGETLASLLRRVGRLSHAKAKEVGLEICAGLAAAHRLGILHRDLKPANLMLDSMGHVRLIDFGLARLVGTRDGVSGSPAYLAPERWDGASATVQSELYALGLVLYEIFTGARPMRAGTLAELRQQHLDGSPLPTDRLVLGLGSEIEGLIRRCLAKDPADRPASVEAVAAVLEQLSPEPPFESRMPEKFVAGWLSRGERRVVQRLLERVMVDTGLAARTCESEREDVGGAEPPLRGSE